MKPPSTKHWKWLAGMAINQPYADLDDPFRHWRICEASPTRVVAYDAECRDAARWTLRGDGWVVQALADAEHPGAFERVWVDAAINQNPGPPHWEIDIHDAATPGLVLSLVRAAWQDVGFGIRQRQNGAWQVLRPGADRSICQAWTEVEALLAALEMAP